LFSPFDLLLHVPSLLCEPREDLAHVEQGAATLWRAWNTLGLSDWDCGRGVVSVRPQDLNVEAASSDVERSSCRFEAPVRSQVLVHPGRELAQSDPGHVPTLKALLLCLRLSKPGHEYRADIIKPHVARVAAAHVEPGYTDDEPPSFRDACAATPWQDESYVRRVDAQPIIESEVSDGRLSADVRGPALGAEPEAAEAPAEGRLNRVP
jgi:hypothetical protein